MQTVRESSRGVSLLGSGCNFKGNIGVNSGEHIYRVPGQEYYNETLITSSKGERWFCSEAGAHRPLAEGRRDENKADERRL
ncbi:MAG: hypothetical protein EOR84_29005 [Mesorhizobium sp.]|nr:MAG: hypothetical protein EOR84_29005 [Mesorhizobium sp.]